MIRRHLVNKYDDNDDEISRNKESLDPTVVSRKYMRVILLDNTQAPTVTGEQVLKKILDKLQ